jgi:hypothetical protein
MNWPGRPGLMHPLSTGSCLGHLGLLTEDETHRFTLTRLGHALKSGAPGSARASILTLASDWMSHGWGHLLYLVQIAEKRI